MAELADVGKFQWLVGSRHLTKGQRAMAVAMIYPEPKRGVHSKLNKSTEGLGFDKAYLSHARTVLQYAPDLADNVLSHIS